MTFWTYMLRCSDGTYYTGHTDDLDRRMHQHSVGEGSAYTAKRRPCELVWSIDCQSRDDAFALERRLKGWSRAKKEAFMVQDWSSLQTLSRSRSDRLSPNGVD